MNSGLRTALRWTARISAGVVAIALVLAGAGAGYEAIAASSDAERFPPPGRLVDIGGFRLHIRCLGRGSPAAIFDSGLGGTSLDWQLVLTPIARFTRACAYDRAGVGWSDRGPLPRSAKQIAHELHALLEKADIGGPYVLVGHSLGGKNIRYYAREHPADVAGMVLVDARNEIMDFHLSPAAANLEQQQLQSQLRLYRFARIFGIARLFGPWLVAGPLPAETREMMAIFGARSLATIEAEADARAANDVELRDAPGLGDKPLVVLASGQNMARSADWRLGQKLQAALSRDSRLTVAKASGHYIEWDRPQLVIDAVHEVVEKARRRAKAG